MGLFDSIPIRLNGAQGGEVTAAWWNAIRTALINAFGDQVTGETSFTIADDQSSSEDVTGLSFDSAEVVFAKISYVILRSDGTTPRRESGTLWATFDNASSSWALDRRSNFGDALNMGADSLTITAGGQVQYQSDSVGGTYSGTLTYRVNESISVES